MLILRYTGVEVVDFLTPRPLIDTIKLSWFGLTLFSVEKLIVSELCLKVFRSTIGLCPYKEIVVLKGIYTW